METNTELSEAELNRMIEALPRVLRRGVIDGLRKVETAIEIVGSTDDAFQWLRR